MHREENEVEKSNTMLQRDLLKLNTLLSKNTQLRYALEQENAVMETEFLHKLKVSSCFLFSCIILLPKA